MGALNTSGCVIVTVCVEVQEFESVTTSVYVPAHKPVIVGVPSPAGVADPFQLYVYPVPVPPVGADVATPLHSPAQVTLFPTLGFPNNCGGELTVTVAVCVQPFASFTVTVYVPTHNPVIVVVVWPPGAQEYW